MRILILITLFLSTCGLASVKNKNIVEKDILYLKSEDFKKICNKGEKKLQFGCIVESTTQGAFELGKILDDSVYFSSVDYKKNCCISIIKNVDLYHLHDLAGYTLSELLKNKDSYSFLKENTDSSSFNYCLIRLSHSVDSVLLPGGHLIELDSMKQIQLINYLNDQRLNRSTKIYIMDCLYSLTFKEQSGKYIHNKVAVSKIYRELLLHNDSLFDIFTKVKHRFEMLDTIRTWMEMDKKYNEIRAMLIDPQPIMFYQILSFNPSTVLESKELCKLKEKALSGIIKNSMKGSFYKDLRYSYLNELLIDNNYTVRFLDGVMNRDNIPNYRLTIEKE
jgi:hypothetical protein